MRKKKVKNTKKVVVGMSGGVDSSYVLAMSDVTMTDSCGYVEERFDESRLAEETAKLLKQNGIHSVQI